MDKSAMGRLKMKLARMEVISEKSAAFWRRKTPAEKIGIVFLLNRMMRKVIEGHLRIMHPEWADERVKAEAGRRMLLRAMQEC